MTCEELSGLFEFYALGILDGPEKEALEEHLGRNCEDCMKEMKSAVQNNALVYRAVPKLDPPRSLRSRILAGFGLETRPLWVRALPWSVSVAAIVVLVLTLVSPRHTPQSFSADAIDFLAAPGTRQVSFGGKGAHGSVLMHREKGLLLVVVNLPAAPSGKMYETWVVPRSGSPRPSGQLKIGSNGDSVARIPGPFDIETVRAVAVSVEQAGSHPTTPDRVLFSAQLGS